jgi:hypothetical protein
VPRNGSKPPLKWLRKYWHAWPVVPLDVASGERGAMSLELAVYSRNIGGITRDLVVRFPSAQNFRLILANGITDHFAHRSGSGESEQSFYALKIYFR